MNVPRLIRQLAGNVHGISLSSSLPLWSPIPPAARRTPEPASMSLPVPFDQVLPGNGEHKKQILTEGRLSNSRINSTVDFFTQ